MKANGNPHRPIPEALHRGPATRSTYREPLTTHIVTGKIVSLKGTRLRATTTP